MSFWDVVEDIGVAAETAVLGPVVTPVVNATVNAVSHWDPFVHFTTDPGPAAKPMPTFGEMRNAPHAELPVEDRGFINVYPSTQTHPLLGVTDELHAAAVKANVFSSIGHPTAPTPPPTPVPTPTPAPVPASTPQPATHTDPTPATAGHGISFDLDFGGGASATGGYHVHLSGLDEMSAEQLIDHLSHPVAAAPAATTGQHMTDTSFGQGTAAPVHLPALDPAPHDASSAAAHNTGTFLPTHQAPAAHDVTHIDEHLIDHYDAAAMAHHDDAMAMHHDPMQSIVAQQPGHEIPGLVT